MDNLHSILLVAVVSIVTILLRFLPFIVFGGNRKTPKFVSYLGQVLPFAIMGMLVVYCLRNTSVISYPFGLPELIACVAVVLLHIWKRNSLISIGGGTVLYMCLVQLVF